MAERRWITHVYTLELRKLLSYRADFWFEFLGSIGVELALAYFLWNAIFSQGGYTELGGYSFRGLMLYYVLIPIFFRLIRGNNFLGLLAYATLGVMQVFIALGLFAAFAGLPPEVHLTPISILGALLLVPLAALLQFTLSAIIEMVAFWMDQVWSLTVMMRFTMNLLGGALIPLTLFSPAWQRALAFTPFPYLVSTLYRTLIGAVSFVEWAQAAAILLAWSGVFALIARVVWRRGLRQYSSVGV